MARLRTWTLLLTAAAAAGCSGSKGGATQGTGAATAGTSAGGSTSGGTTGSAGTSAGTGAAGGSGCGLNAQLCAGTCAVTLTDPKNCGACGVVCQQGEACVSGSCAAGSSCPEGTTDCGGACVDPISDSANCGGCGLACPTGQGCAGGSCAQAVVLSGTTPSCPGGGPAVVVDDGGPNGCTGNLAQTTFRFGLCTCADAILNATFHADAFNSAIGAYRDGGAGGAVGVDGQLTLNGALDVSGACWVDGSLGLTVNTQSSVGLDLNLNGPALANGALSVGNDARINGDLTTNAPVDIAQTLYVPQGATVGSQVTEAHLSRGPVAVPPPCDCSPSQLIDVAGIVAGGQLFNDDQTLSLSAAALSGVNSPIRLDLPCGRYYLTEITSNAAAAIAVHGRTALFIGGDVRPNGDLEITLDPTATLDLFVGGDLVINSAAQFGSTLVPAQTRIYVAGSQATLNGNLLLAGNFYLPSATLVPDSALDLYGSIFAGSFQENGETAIHYDSAILQAGAECLDGGGGSSGPDAGAFIPDGGCQSCRDCQNQACVAGACGTCTQSSDCCAPLLCKSGSCQLILE